MMKNLNRKIPQLENSDDDEELQAAVVACQERIAQWKSKFREELEKRKILKAKIEQQLKRIAVQRQTIEDLEKYEKCMLKLLEQKEKLEDPASQKKLKEIREDEERLRKMKDLWEKFKEEYEKLPLAQKRREAELDCRKAYIQLIRAKYELAEAQKRDKLKKEIDKRILQNNIIRIAQQYVDNKKWVEEEAEWQRKLAEKEKYSNELEKECEELEEKLAKQQEEEKVSVLNRTQWRMPMSSNIQSIMEQMPKHKSKRFHNVDADTISVNTIMLEEMVMQTDESSAAASVPPTTEILEEDAIVTDADNFILPEGKEGDGSDKQVEEEQEEEAMEYESTEPMPKPGLDPKRKFFDEDKKVFSPKVKDKLESSYIQDSRKDRYIAQQAHSAVREFQEQEYTELGRSKEELTRSPYVGKGKHAFHERNAESSEVHREKRNKSDQDFRGMSKCSTPQSKRSPRDPECHQRRIQSPLPHNKSFIEAFDQAEFEFEEYGSASRRFTQVTTSNHPSPEKVESNSRHAKQKTSSKPQIRSIEEASFDPELLKQRELVNASPEMERCHSIDNISAILDSEYSGAGDLISQVSAQGYNAAKYSTFKNFSPPISLGFLNETMDQEGSPKMESNATNETGYGARNNAAPSGFLAQYKKTQNFF